MKTKQIFPWNVKVGQEIPIIDSIGIKHTVKIVGIVKRRGRTMAGNVWDIHTNWNMFPVLSFWGKTWFNGRQYPAEKVTVIKSGAQFI